MIIIGMENTNPYIKSNCVAYVRVSSEEQTIENQRHQISLYCQRNPFDIKYWFQDEGISAWNKPALARPGFTKMLDFIKTCEARPDAILVYKLDRLGRDQADTIAMFKLIEKELGIPIISVSESWLQSTDPQIRQLLISVFTWFAQFESEQISQRTKAGMQRAKLQGVQIGRKIEAHVTSEAIAALLSKGLSHREVAYELQCSRGTVYNRLNSGQYYQNKLLKKGKG